MLFARDGRGHDAASRLVAVVEHRPSVGSSNLVREPHIVSGSQCRAQDAALAWREDPGKTADALDEIFPSGGEELLLVVNLVTASRHVKLHAASNHVLNDVCLAESDEADASLLVECGDCGAVWRSLQAPCLALVYRGGFVKGHS